MDSNNNSASSLANAASQLQQLASIVSTGASSPLALPNVSAGMSNLPQSRFSISDILESQKKQQQNALNNFYNPASSFAMPPMNVPGMGAFGSQFGPMLPSALDPTHLFANMHKSQYGIVGSQIRKDDSQPDNHNSPVSDLSSTSPVEKSEERTDSPSHLSKKSRKARTIFTDKQLQSLEESFDKQKYLSVQDRMDLAAKMGLTDTQVKTWYQNRRTKWKRQTAVGIELLTEASNFAAVQRLLQTNPYWGSCVPPPPGLPGNQRVPFPYPNMSQSLGHGSDALINPGSLPNSIMQQPNAAFTSPSMSTASSSGAFGPFSSIRC